MWHTKKHLFLSYHHVVLQHGLHGQIVEVVPFAGVLVLGFEGASKGLCSPYRFGTPSRGAEADGTARDIARKTRSGKAIREGRATP